MIKTDGLKDVTGNLSESHNSKPHRPLQCGKKAEIEAFESMGPYRDNASSRVTSHGPLDGPCVRKGLKTLFNTDTFKLKNNSG